MGYASGVMVYPPQVFTFRQAVLGELACGVVFLVRFTPPQHPAVGVKEQSVEKILGLFL
jgi:hypothetical protein